MTDDDGLRLAFSGLQTVGRLARPDSVLRPLRPRSRDERRPNVLVSVTCCDWLEVLCPGCDVPVRAVAQNGVFAGQDGESRSRFDCGRLPHGLPWIHSVSPQIRTTQKFDHGQLNVPACQPDHALQRLVNTRPIRRHQTGLIERPNKATLSGDRNSPDRASNLALYRRTEIVANSSNAAYRAAVTLIPKTRHLGNASLITSRPLITPLITGPAAA